MKQFVPLTDELLDQMPECIPGPLVPFNLDYPCLHWLALEEDEEEEQEVVCGRQA